LVRDSAAVGCFLVAAVWVMGNLAVAPTRRVLAANVNDEAQVEWFLANGVRVLTERVNPFFSPQMGAPLGVNMLDNTAIYGLSIPMAPFTLLFGVRIAFLLLMILAMSATAASWYLMFSRALRLSRGASFVGGALCGFGPALVAHANAHPNIVAQFLIPWLIWHLTALAKGAPPIRTGLILAALTLWQIFINEELLLITALGFGLFGLVWLAQRPAGWPSALRRLITGLAVTAAVTVPLLAYPLYFQFFGPQHYRGLDPRSRSFGADLASFVTFASGSIGGNTAASGHIAQNAAEENSCFGIPLLLLVGFFSWYLRRRPVIPAMIVSGLVLSAFSLGDDIRLHGRFTGVPGPFALVDDLPLLDAVVPTRLVLAVTPIIAIILALGCDRLFAVLGRGSRMPAGLPVRGLVGILVAAALLASGPTPIRAVGGEAVPEFVTSGQWRQFVPPGMTLVAIPLPRPYSVQPLRWAASTNDDLALAGGYFLGPRGDPAHPGDETSVFTPLIRPTAEIWEGIASSGRIPSIGQRQQVALRADLAYWRAAVLVLPPGGRAQDLLTATSQLVGEPPIWAGGLWVWDVRNLR
jgi:hypothetical protein